MIIMRSMVVDNPTDQLRIDVNIMARITFISMDFFSVFSIQNIVKTTKRSTAILIRCKKKNTWISLAPYKKCVCVCYLERIQYQTMCKFLTIKFKWVETVFGRDFAIYLNVTYCIRKTTTTIDNSYISRFSFSWFVFFYF